MKRRTTALLAGVAGLAIWCLAGGAADPPQAQEGVEVLTRGPVHEAYAEPSGARAEASAVVPKEPPAPIEEVPPDSRPEGDNVVWIPGYWAWDDDRADFIWVSGFWRDAPPDRQWMPGHWQQVEGGWSWVGGFWTPTDTAEVQYVPAPPEPVEAAPATPAPNPTDVYVPGVWVWRETRYAWRPGFWVPYHAGWTYVPATYVWTPGGYLFVEGYWDYALHNRGLLFAPVLISPRTVVAGWTYTPSYVVSPNVLVGALFVRPSYRHYYFGDYFDPGYNRRGYVSWVDYRFRRDLYDPNFAYYRAANRGNANWERGLRELYVARREGTVPRPPATFAEQARFAANPSSVRVQNSAVLRNLNVTDVSNFLSVATPINQVNNTRVNLVAAGAEAPTIRVQQVSADQRARVQQSARQFRSVVEQRQRFEGRAAGDPSARAEGPRPARFELPKATPDRTRPADRPDRPAARTPPAQPKVPPNDPRVQPPPSKGPDRTRPADPKAPAPKADPKAPAPKADPKAPAPKADPKGPPPKTEPKAPAPKTEPKAPAPKTEPKGPPPKTEPKAPAPKPEPKPPAPKAEPKGPPPKAEPKPPAPKAPPKAPEPKPKPKTPEPEPKTPPPEPKQPD